MTHSKLTLTLLTTTLLWTVPSQANLNALSDAIVSDAEMRGSPAETSGVRTNNGSASGDLNVRAACAMARSDCWSNALADCNSIGYVDGEVRRTAVTSSGTNRSGAYCSVSCSYVCVK